VRIGLRRGEKISLKRRSRFALGNFDRVFLEKEKKKNKIFSKNGTFFQKTLYKSEKV